MFEHRRPEPTSDRYTYEPRQIRASTVKPDDVLLHRNKWRLVTDIWNRQWVEWLTANPHEYPLTRRQAALIRKYLSTSDQWVLIKVRFEKRGRREPVERFVPYRCYDLVTIQEPTETHRRHGLATQEPGPHSAATTREDSHD